MQTRQAILVSILSSVTTLIVVMILLISAGTATAQPLNPLAGEGEGASPTPQATSPSTGEGFGPASLPGEPEFEVAPQAAQSPSDESLSYYYILGSHLLPRMSATTHVYGGNGCIYVTSNGGDLRLQYPVLLEEGSVIKNVRIDYRDTSTTEDIVVWLTTYTPGQAAIDLTSVSSIGSAGLGSAVSPEITHIVEAATYQYTLNVDWGALDNSTQICGIRVAYYPVSPFALALPLISRPAAR